MIECPGCQTFNPEGEAACLACGATLPKTAAAGAAAANTRCPNGHPIDPSWKNCPYCGRPQAGEDQRAEDATRPLTTRLEPEAAGSSGRRTRLEGEAAWPEPAPRGPAPTRLEPPERAAGNRTVLQQDGAVPAGPPTGPSVAAASHAVASAPASGGKLVGVLAAPSAGPNGGVFAVRAGKNLIGAARSCDVVVAGDSQVSHEHAVLLYRGGTFQLADRLSTNGTWVNGEEVPANGAVALRDRDRIRIGSTDLQFFAIDLSGPRPAEGAAPSAPGFDSTDREA